MKSNQVKSNQIKSTYVDEMVGDNRTGKDKTVNLCNSPLLPAFSCDGRGKGREDKIR